MAYAIACPKLCIGDLARTRPVSFEQDLCLQDQVGKANGGLQKQLKDQTDLCLDSPYISMP